MSYSGSGEGENTRQVITKWYVSEERARSLAWGGVRRLQREGDSWAAYLLVRICKAIRKERQKNYFIQDTKTWCLWETIISSMCLGGAYGKATEDEIDLGKGTDWTPVQRD